METKPKKAQGCFRAGVPRPWRFKGGKIAAGKRYRESHKEELKKRHKEEYNRHKERYRKASSLYRQTHKEQVFAINKAWQRKYRIRMRAEMISAYGGKCECCGEPEPMFLDMDHRFNDGKEWRKRHSNSLVEMQVLKSQGWPKTNHQLLCCNCNQGKARNGGICPHKKKNQS